MKKVKYLIKKTYFMAYLLIISFLLVVSVQSVFAGTITATLNNPNNLQYDNGLIKLNLTCVTGGTGQNATNATWRIGTTYFVNSTVNGSNPPASDANKGFSFTLNTSHREILGANAQFTVNGTCYNSSDTSIVSTAVSAATVTYTIDTTLPTVLLQIPLKGSSIIPSGPANTVTFEYKPTETNLGNCSLHLNNQVTKSSTSGTTSPNITSGTTNRFTYGFGADNATVRTVVTCRDLAGQVGVSSNITFGVLVSPLPPQAKKQILQARQQEQQSAQRQFAFGTTSSQTLSHFQRYAWLYLVIFVVLIVFAIKYKWFK